MNMLRRLRFRFLVQKSRFAEALAICDLNDSSLTSDRCWALYRLGCYRTVSENARKPRSGREAVAVGVSLAACGRSQEATAVLRQAVKRGLLRGSLLPQSTGALAPFCLGLALELSHRLEGQRPLKAALALADGRADEALAMIRTALAAGDAIRDPDVYLLKANAIGRPEAILELVNRYLAAHGLSSVAVMDRDLPPSLGNLQGASAFSPIRGPLVSITMPAYNTQDRIGRAIESLLKQSYRDIEVIVVDDASTDETARVVEKIAANDPRVRLFRHDRNSGPYVARNLALEHALGAFVTCHDSDDWAHPEKIARQVAPLLQDPRLVFTMSDWVRMQDDGFFYARPIYPLARINPASPLFRREPVLARAGPYEAVRTGADSEYIARLKLIFGRRAWTRLKRPLAFGAHRSGSLMTDENTGVTRGMMNFKRLDYWERWNREHIMIARAMDGEKNWLRRFSRSRFYRGA